MDLSSPFNFTLAAMQLVYSSRGIIFAEKMQKGDVLLANTLENQELANNLALGVKPGLQISLQNGNNFLANENNSVYTPNGWCSLKDLKPGDLILQRIIFNPPSSKGGEIIHFNNELNTDAMPILVPKKMSEDFAKWLGIFIMCGEFNHHDGRVSVRLDDPSLIDEYYLLSKKIFRITPLVLKDKRPGNRKLEHYFISQNIVKFLSQNIGRGSLQKIPNFLMSGSNLEHLAFIEGLSFNFSLYKKKNPIIYQGESKFISEFVALILRHNGFIISVYKDDYSEQEIRPDRYTVLIMGQHPNCIRLNLNPKLNEYLSHPLSILVDISEYFDKLNIQSFHPHYRAWLRLKKDNLKICTWDIAESFGINLTDNQYYFTQVKNIKSLANIKQVTLKVLYPEGFLLNNTVLSGQY